MAVLALAEIDPEFEGKRAILAYRRDSQPLAGEGLRLAPEGARATVEALFEAFLPAEGQSTYTNYSRSRRSLDGLAGRSCRSAATR